MAKSLSAAAINSFDAMVKHAYQGSGRLRGSVRQRTGIVGSSHRFPKLGKGTATKRLPQTDVIPMNVAHTNATATLEDWNAAEYTDVFDQQKTNVKEQKELATTIAKAIRRREDQLIIDAMEAASSTLTVSNDIGGTDTDLNTAKVRRAKRLLDDQGADDEARSFAISAFGLEAMLGDSDADTFDKNAAKVLVNGAFTRWVGFDFITIETRAEGGLTKDGSNDRTCFAYDHASTGLAVGIDFRTEANYIPEKTSWLANGLYSAGSVAVDALGLVEVTAREPAA